MDSHVTFTVECKKPNVILAETEFRLAWSLFQQGLLYLYNQL